MPKRIFPTVETLIATGKATVAIAARVLGFSRQAFYQWVSSTLSAREKQETEMFQAIRQIHAEDPEFGYRFIAEELIARGMKVSERRVWRICSRHHIFSTVMCKNHSGKVGHGSVAHDDLLKRHFYANTLNTAWVTDITERWAGEGKIYWWRSKTCVREESSGMPLVRE